MDDSDTNSMMETTTVKEGMGTIKKMEPTDTEEII